MHGTPLVYESATITSPSEWRGRGERGSFAKRGDEYRAIFVPESPPMNERVPNGVSLELNLKTGACVFPRVQR